MILLLQQLLDDIRDSSVQLVELHAQLVGLLLQMIRLHAMELLVELELTPSLGLVQQGTEAEEATKECMLGYLSSVESIAVEQR